MKEKCSHVSLERRKKQEEGGMEKLFQPRYRLLLCRATFSEVLPLLPIVRTRELWRGKTTPGKNERFRQLRL